MGMVGIKQNRIGQWYMYKIYVNIYIYIYMRYMCRMYLVITFIFQTLRISEQEVKVINYSL